jgi:hypothetical protein
MDFGWFIYVKNYQRNNYLDYWIDAVVYILEWLGFVIEWDLSIYF